MQTTTDVDHEVERIARLMFAASAEYGKVFLPQYAESLRTFGLHPLLDNLYRSMARAVIDDPGRRM